jgi:hypothetical protein
MKLWVARRAVKSNRSSLSALFVTMAALISSTILSPRRTFRIGPKILISS